MFKNRQHAGKLLGIAVAEAVTKTPESKPVRTIVVGLARGGIVVAKEVASILCAPLTLIVTKLINSPQEPDLPVAAVSSRGVLVTSDTFDDSIEGLPTYVRNQQMQLARLTRTLETHWLQEAGWEPPPIANKRVVLVSDCCMSGIAEMAALRTLKQDRPNQMILATPVITEQAKYRLEAECQLVISLQTPSHFGGAMQFFEEFSHVEDGEIVACLKNANRHGTSAPA
jgi:putative phosphoribosyl transferase